MPASLRSVVFVFAFLGFGMKAGIIPLHLWLPRAHPIAPSPVSALMSGVMLKTAIYGFVRFSFDFLGGGPGWWGYLALVAGAASGVLGVLYAIAEHDLKRLLAYHSVENIGIIYLGLGAALVLMANDAPLWTALALMAALLHTFNHAMFKSLLFLGAGAIADAAHTLDLEELGGLLKRMRVTGAMFLIACCSIVGLPLFNGFVSEWLTFRSFLAALKMTSLSPAIVLPLMPVCWRLIGGLAAACFAKVYGVAFLGRPRSAEAERRTKFLCAMLAGMGVLAAICVLIGICARLSVVQLGATVRTLFPGLSFPASCDIHSRVIPWIALPRAGCRWRIAARHPLKSSDYAHMGVRTCRAWTSACSTPPPPSQSHCEKCSRKCIRRTATVEVVPGGEAIFPHYQSHTARVRTTSFEKSLYRPGVDADRRRGAPFTTTPDRQHSGLPALYLRRLIALLMFMRFA